MFAVAFSQNALRLNLLFLKSSFLKASENANAASSTSLYDLASDFADFKSAPGRGIGAQKKVGDLEANWETSLKSIIAAGKTSSNSAVPPAAASAIRIYGRYFDLKTLPAF